MLDGLDTVDWSSLTHAHGPATGVPDLLRSLLSEDEGVWMRACAELHETLWHQGTVFPASAAAVPFLFELLARPDVRDPGRAVSPSGCAASLLCEIATGEGSLRYVLRVDGEQSLRRRLAELGRSPEAALGEEGAMTAAIHRGVSAGLRHLLPYVTAGEGLGASVAEALGHFPEHASWLVPAIDGALASGCEQHVRRVLAQSKARLTSG